MTYHGHIENGTVVLDEPNALPDGVRVEVSLVVLGDSGTANPPLWQAAQDLAKRVPNEEWNSVPSDGARNLDHYLYGAPKNGE